MENMETHSPKMDSTTIDNESSLKLRSGKQGLRVKFKKRPNEATNHEEKENKNAEKHEGRAKHNPKPEKIRNGSCGSRNNKRIRKASNESKVD